MLNVLSSAALGEGGGEFFGQLLSKLKAIRALTSGHSVQKGRDILQSTHLLLGVGDFASIGEIFDFWVKSGGKEKQNKQTNKNPNPLILQ